MPELYKSKNGGISNGVKKVYLDHNATTPVHPEVLEVMLPYHKEVFGNASSVHSFGQEARKAIDQAREKVAELLQCEAREIIFTSGGTEADNFALKGVCAALKEKGNHIVTSSIEHQAVLNTCKYLEKKGVKVTYLAVDKYGLVEPDKLKEAITEETILVSVMHANNEIGTIEPIAEIGSICKEKGVYFHTDAVQTVGKIPIRVNELKVDLLSLSAHKIYGPKGIGALYIRKGTKIEAFIHGGHHERHLRAGTENVAGIVGLGKTCELAQANLEVNFQHLISLRDKLEKGIRERISYVHLNGHPEKRLPNTLNLSFEFVEGESMILSLDLKGIAVSTGSACTSGSLEPSYVLLAMGTAPEISHGSLRFSLGKDNTLQDIDYVLENLPPIIERLRSMSPLYRK